MKHLAIVTGSSRGLGLAIAGELVDRGHVLLGIARRASDALAGRAAAAGTSIEQWQADLSDPLPVAVRLEAWLGAQPGAEFASVTLINNAALLARPGPLQDVAPDELQAVLRVGLEAPMQLSAAFLRASARWPGARRILHVSSGLGRRAMAGQAAYCAVKAGLDHHARCVALDEARRPGGARVVSLAPGVVATDMQVALRGADERSFPDVAMFRALHDGGTLSSPREAALRVLGYLARADFGHNVVADVRDA